MYAYIRNYFLFSSVVQVKFSQSSVATTEEEGRVLVTVEAMGDLSSDFSIIVMAINGSAVGKLLSWRIVFTTLSPAVHIYIHLINFSENADFTGNMWQVDFLSGVTEAGFSIPIVQDSVPEDTEEFSLQIVILSPTNQSVTVGEPNRLTVTIRAPITGTDIHMLTGLPTVCTYIGVYPVE